MLIPSIRPAIFLTLLLSFASPVFPAVEEEDDDSVDSSAITAMPDSRAVNSAPLPAGTLHLSPARQQTGGLMIEPLKPASFQPETPGYGKVLDIQPLLELRVRYRAARADTEVAAAALGLAEKNRRRLSELHRAEIVAGRELVQAEAQWQSDKTREDAARRLAGEIRREAEHAFGMELSRLALDGDSTLFEDLATHRRLLLRVALPSGAALPSRGAALFVARDHDRAHAAKAELISPAPATDDLVQGETWFFHTADEHLRAGMRVHAWAPAGGEQRQGVVIPLSAVVWHAGKPWAYRRVGEDGFARTEIAGYRDYGYGGGWFVEKGFAPGESIVVTGGQMLLSEEFRGQIPDKDDD
jgi:hypothetical protein